MHDESTVDGQPGTGQKGSASDLFEAMRALTVYPVMIGRLRVMYSLCLFITLVPAIAWLLWGLWMAAILTLVVAIPVLVVLLIAFIGALRAKQELYLAMPALRDHYQAFNTAVGRDVVRPGRRARSAP